MDLLDCQTRSQCSTCHHFSPGSGCALLAALDAYEASLEPPTTRAPVFAWADVRASAADA